MSVTRNTLQDKIDNLRKGIQFDKEKYLASQSKTNEGTQLTNTKQLQDQLLFSIKENESKLLHLCEELAAIALDLTRDNSEAPNAVFRNILIRDPEVMWFLIPRINDNKQLEAELVKQLTTSPDDNPRTFLTKIAKTQPGVFIRLLNTNLINHKKFQAAINETIQSSMNNIPVVSILVHAPEVLKKLENIGLLQNEKNGNLLTSIPWKIIRINSSNLKHLLSIDLFIDAATRLDDDNQPIITQLDASINQDLLRLSVEKGCVKIAKTILQQTDTIDNKTIRAIAELYHKRFSHSKQEMPDEFKQLAEKIIEKFNKKSTMTESTGFKKFFNTIYQKISATNHSTIGPHNCIEALINISNERNPNNPINPDDLTINRRIE